MGGTEPIWWMRMREGADGPDYGPSIWATGEVALVGLAWSLDDVARTVDGVDEADLLRVTGGETWKGRITTFLNQVRVGHWILFANNATREIACGRVAPGYHNRCRGPGDHWWTRPLAETKSFPLDDLPAVYRLLTHTGRASIQQMSSFRSQAELLVHHRTVGEVCDAVVRMSDSEFLDWLPPSAWEALCMEHLRDAIGLRLLALRLGSTLKDDDIVGVNSAFDRVVVQCKNSSDPYPIAEVDAWACLHPTIPQARKYFACRGGFEGDLGSAKCRLIDRTTITTWLRSVPEYSRALRVL